MSVQLHAVAEKVLNSVSDTKQNAQKLKHKIC